VPSLAARTLQADKRGRVTLKVICTGVAARCTGSLELRFGGRAIAKVPVALDGAKTVRVTLPARLRRRATMRASAILALTAAGHEGEVRRTLKITIRGRR
jgi:hypothetical protein